jgi:hypothetical protein
MLEWTRRAPVALIVFNRPDTTARVFAEVARARPAKLFVIADGPRTERSDEAGRCQAVRDIVQRVDWPCELITNFSEQNLGCKRRLSSGLDWLFSQTDEAIILEDDCVPHPDFFRFADELLKRYRDDQRVMMISGDNFQFGLRRSDDSYYFSRYTHIWGWATWRRAWRLYDHRMSRWPELRAKGWLFDMLKDRVAADYWTRIFDDTFSERISSWDYPWTFSAWVNNGLTVLPGVNLVSNIGFGGNATHNLNPWNRFASLPAEAMRFPLAHPAQVDRQQEADEFTQRKMYTRPLWRRLAGQVLRALRA